MKLGTKDKVVVKTWDEMLMDKGIEVDSQGDLAEKGTSYSFGKRMKRFCGRSAEVREINEKGEIRLTFDEFGPANYIFREWMLEAEEKTTTVYFVEKE